MPLITQISAGSGSVNPSCPGPSGCNEAVGGSVSVTATAGSGNVFSGWLVTGASCSGGASSSPCQFTMPDNTVTVSASFTQPTTITLTPSPSSVSVGSLVTLSGTISPNPGAVTVAVSYSLNSGSVWFVLLSVTSNGTGAYSATWNPPEPGSYLLQASWAGNNGLGPSQSPTESLSVTGSVPPTPSVLLSAPSTIFHGQTVTLSVTVFNPTGSALNANVTIEITGPNNYVLFEVMQDKVSANGHSTSYYDWAVPTQTGRYAVTVSLLPATPSVDIENIQVT